MRAGRFSGEICRPFAEKGTMRKRGVYGEKKKTSDEGRPAQAEKQKGSGGDCPADPGSGGIFDLAAFPDGKGERISRNTGRAAGCG